jgi:phospholipase C
LYNRGFRRESKEIAIMSLGDIKHVVILVQENRSFDEYFGTFPGATGFSDPSPLFGNPWPGSNVSPFRLSTFTGAGEAFSGCNHDWTPMHAAYANGQMNGWNPQSILTENAPNPEGDNPPGVVGYYTADDIPYHWALAQTFALCDHYFGSVLSGTAPNRLYLMSGCIADPSPNPPPAGEWAGPAINNPPDTATPANPKPPYGEGLLSWQTYADMIDQANLPGISWKVYDETDSPPPWLPIVPMPANGWGSLNVLDLFKSDRSNPDFSLGYGNFETDAKAGHLPTVSWICQPFGVTEWHQYHPADGAYYISQIVNAILTGVDNDNGGVAFWNNTVFILTYDESDGHFDHIAPPVPVSPGSGPESWLNIYDGLGLQPIGAGFRVPAIIISPWTVGVGVITQPFDHTSILQFLEKVTGVQCLPNLPVGGWRRQTFGDLTSAFDFENPVGAAEVIGMLPPVSTVFQWKLNADARHQAREAVPATPPNPQPGWPPPTQSCVANSPAFSSAGVLLQLNRENSGAVPRLGPTGSATMENAVIVTVYGFEPDEFIELKAGAPPWMPQSVLHVPQIPVAGGNTKCDTRVPTVTALTGGGPGEFTFQCTQVSANPNSPVAPNQSGVAMPFTFGISVTFNFPTSTFGFRKGMIRTIGLGVSFTVDTTVTVTVEMKLDGGTLVEEPLGACAQLAERILEAEVALAIAQREPQGPGSAERITAMMNALAVLQQQYNQYCGSWGSGAPPAPGGPIHLGG